MRRIIALFLLAGCHPTPIPPEPDVVVVPVDASPGTDAAPTPGQDASAKEAGPLDACGAACANLKTLGCLASDTDTCADVCRRVQDAGLTDLKPSCLAAATSKAAARACGTVRCP